ncbi:MAG: 2-oxoacid:acceptor oxidoreductase family protein, partial [Bacteroidales bacterium]|nr:2-oxoacid:acceptor oxidoreductase family protein [Bacteroidales bacterium]
KEGGLLIYDPNGISVLPKRKDINVCSISAVDESIALGNPKAFNMVVLGAYLKKKPLLTLENVISGLKKSLPARHHHLIPLNEQAIKVGMDKVKDINKL